MIIQLYNVSLTSNRLGFSESGRARMAGQVDRQILLCNPSYLKANEHEIWWFHTMSKALSANNRIFDDVMTVMFLSCHLVF